MSKLDLPLRFMDYFFECGLSPDVQLVEKAIIALPDEDPSNKKRTPEPTPESSDRKTSISPIQEIIDTASESSELANATVVGPTSPVSTDVANHRSKEALQRRAALRSSRTVSASPALSSQEFDTSTGRRQSIDDQNDVYVPPRRSSMDARRMSRTSRKPSSTNDEIPRASLALLGTGEYQRRIANGGHPLHWSYEPSTICRYPSADYSDSKFPEYLSMFCYPNALKFVYDDNGRPAERFHSFIVTEETGAKLFGVCVTVYEPLSTTISSQLDSAISMWKDLRFKSGDLEYIVSLQAQLAKYQEMMLHAKMGMVPELGSNTYGTVKLDDRKALRNAEDMVKHYTELLKPLSDLLVDCENVYCPRSYGLLSHWPFYDFMKDWLLCSIKSTRGDLDFQRDDTFIPLERLAVNLIHEIPLPPPGKLEICVNSRQFSLYCSRPPLNRVPLIRNFSFYPLFKALSVENIVSVFEAMLNERKIIILSSHLSMLNVTAEALTTLFFPFYWQHIYIPVLPEKLLSYLQAPMPYMIGLQRDYFSTKQRNEYLPPDAFVVDLDYNIITGDNENVRIPPSLSKKLVHRLESAIGMVPSSSSTKTRKFERGIPISSQYALPFEKFAPHCHESNLHRYANVPLNTPAASRRNSKSESADKKNRDSTASFHPLNTMNSSSLAMVSSSSIDSLSSSRHMQISSEPRTVKDRRQSTLSIATFSTRGSKFGGRNNMDEPVSATSRVSSTYSLFKKGSPRERTGNTSTSSVFDPLAESGMLSSITRDGHHFTQASGVDVIMESTAGSETSSIKLTEHPTEQSHQSVTSGVMRVITKKKFSYLKSKSSSSRHHGASSHSLHQNDDAVSMVRSPSISSRVPSSSSLSLATPVLSTVSEAKTSDCSICYKSLRLETEGGVYKCDGCNFYIHGNCLTISDSRPCKAMFREDGIQDSFLAFFVALVKNYRQFLIPFDKRKDSMTQGGGAADMPLQEDWFKKNDFVASFEKDNRAFIEVLCDTQAFVQFTLERAERPETDHEVLFFDELIKMKKNRSVLKISKLDTPFINDTRSDISSTIFTLTPFTEGLSHVQTKGIRSIPHRFDQGLLCVARPFEPLVSEADHRRTRTMANEIIQRARLAASSKRKQDISKWMKSKWRTRTGATDAVLLSFLTDEQRKELFEERLASVSEVIDNYEAYQVDSLSLYEVESALRKLHEQNVLLMRATDEEQLVDVTEQDDLQTIYSRLFRVITTFEDRKEHLTDLVEDQTHESPAFSELNVEESGDSENAQSSAQRRNNGGRGRLVLPKIDAHSSFDNLMTTEFVTTSGGPAIRNESHRPRRATKGLPSPGGTVIEEDVPPTLPETSDALNVNPDLNIQL